MCHTISRIVFDVEEYTLLKEFTVLMLYITGGSEEIPTRSEDSKIQTLGTSRDVQHTVKTARGSC